MYDLWRYRTFIWEAALGDLRYRYAGSAIGVFWNVLTPLLLLVMYTVIFSRVLPPRSTGGMDSTLFPLYLSAGFLPWSAFADGLLRGANALLVNAAYLKKLPIPEHVFVSATWLSATLSMGIALLLLFGLALVLGAPAALTWLVAPLVLLLWQVVALGLSLVLSVLTVFFRDVLQVLGVVVQLWMWSLPIVYYEEILPQPLRDTLRWNPGYPFVSAFREALLFNRVPGLDVWLLMAGWGAILVALGAMCFGRMRGDMRDAL